MKFSERNGFTQARAALQIDSVDAPLRIALFHALRAVTVEEWWDSTGQNWGYGRNAARLIWTEFWRLYADEFEKLNSYMFNEVLKENLTTCEWYEIYNLLEFCFSVKGVYLSETAVNRCLIRDSSAYRISKGIAVPISDDVELGAIDDSLRIGDEFVGARKHIDAALAKLSLRPIPDLRNAIT